MHGPGSLLPLRLEALVFEARGRRIIDGVSLILEPRVRTVIIGPNGAGKSVLLRLCHGLLRPTSGRIEWNMPELPGGPRRQAMVFQRPVLLRRSALANVKHALAVARVPRGEREPRALDALRKAGLEPLDEPTANLDPGATHEIDRLIAAMHAAGTKIVMDTHNLGQAKRLSDEILFLHQGRLVERASAEQFFKRPASIEAAQFLEGELPW